MRDYYGLVMDIERFKRAVENMDKMRKGEIDFSKEPERIKTFVEEFNLLDPSTYADVVVVADGSTSGSV